MKKMLALLLATVMVTSLSAAIAEGQKEVTLKVASIWSAETEANRAPFLKTLALTGMAFDGKIYQLPYAKASSCLYCNTALTDEELDQVSGGTGYMEPCPTSVRFYCDGCQKVAADVFRTENRPFFSGRPECS